MVTKNHRKAKEASYRRIESNVEVVRPCSGGSRNLKRGFQLEARANFKIILIFTSYATPGAHIGVSRIYLEVFLNNQ